MLSAEERERYARHILLKEIGGPGQQRLKAATVALVGAGGLGAPAALYLAAAGVGRLRIIDDDRVALSNLQRQVVYRTADVAMPKAERA
ncbi:MAG TPA: ThiF family adenylyltransferase, partial [Candidatus Binatia bacterium]|nr:ThiF family adenylyltransferase [Candidatus Binatia bacterium]